MADKINPSTIFLWIDTNGGTSYDKVICLKDFSFPRTINEIDASTMCGPDSRPGLATYGPIPFNGHVYIDADAATVSAYDLDTVMKAKTTVGWKIGAISPTTGMVTYTGTGYISKLEDKYSDSQVAEYSGSLAIYGDYVTTPT